MNNPKNENKNTDRSRLNMLERSAVYILPLLVIWNVFNAFDTPPAYAGSSAALFSSGFDLLVAAIEAWLWFHLFSGRTLSDLGKNKKKNDDK